MRQRTVKKPLATKLIKEVRHNMDELQKLNHIINHIPVAVLMTDKNGVIEHVNPHFCTISGYSSDELVGKTPAILKSDFHSKDDYREMWEIISSGKTWSGVFKNFKKNGEVFWENAIISSVKNTKNEITHYIGIKQEITQQLYLQRRVSEQNESILSNFDKTLEALVTIVEDRDSYTGGHSKRVALYSKMIASAIGLGEEECDLVYKAGVLHDIGKISTPDNILLKPDRLNVLEHRIIKRHVETSYAMLSTIPMYQQIADIVILHHERYDGLGYPNGLKGDEISLLGHIMIVADAFDAMTTNRIYKSKKGVAEALAELDVLCGAQFHPAVVKAAKDVLAEVSVEQNISQLPQTAIEQERFAYFYKDQTTEAFNSKYLNYVLNQNSLDKEFICVNVVYMHHFGSYNASVGWANGDKMLRGFADILIAKYPKAYIFRIHGDDFVIIGREHADVNTEELLSLEVFKESGIVLTHRHIDLRKDAISSLQELEILILKNS